VSFTGRGREGPGLAPGDSLWGDVAGDLCDYVDLLQVHAGTFPQGRWGQDDALALDPVALTVQYWLVVDPLSPQIRCAPLPGWRSTAAGRGNAPAEQVYYRSK